jgi:hypothetical protein
LDGGLQVCGARPDYASEVRQLEDGTGETPIKQQKKNQTKINLRQFFGANVKFHKNLRRYLLSPPLSPLLQSSKIRLPSHLPHPWLLEGTSTGSIQSMVVG